MNLFRAFHAKYFATIVLCSAWGSDLSAQHTPARNLYAYNAFGTYSLYEINRQTGEATAAFGIPYTNGITYYPPLGVFYSMALTTHFDIEGNYGYSFYELSPGWKGGRELHRIKGVLPIDSVNSLDVGSLSYNPADGYLYGQVGLNFYRIDPHTGKAKDKTPDLDCNNCLGNFSSTFDLEGNLWMIAQVYAQGVVSAYDLRKFDVTSGAELYSVPLTRDESIFFYGTIAFDPETHHLWASRLRGIGLETPELGTIDTATGEFTLIKSPFPYAVLLVGP